ncbi:MAG: Arc family DNA-binding protein [Kiritimatiellae bacterium]|nr:Arc family DNA-binding protein [Kiritimatiellia bacterium]
MPCLTVRDLPPRTLSSLKTRAKSNHRSLNGEILFIFDWIVDHGMKTPPPVAGMSDPVVTRQKSEMESLIGSWRDKRTTGEIADDIYAARTLGREVTL